MEIRQLPAVEKRVETGPIQFGSDWPGFFSRGDDTFNITMKILGVIRHYKTLPPEHQPPESWAGIKFLEGYVKSLQSTVVGLNPLDEEEVKSP